MHTSTRRSLPRSRLASAAAVLTLAAFALSLAHGCGKGPAEPAKAPDAGSGGELPKVEVFVAGKKAEGASIPWEPKPLNKANAINRMRLQAQNGKWDGLEKLSATAITYDDKDLLSFGHWYRAILAGRAGRDLEAMAHLQAAVKYGFKNADDMLSNESLQGLQGRDDFVQLVKDLSARLEREMHERFEKLAKASMDPSLETPAWKPDLADTGGKPFFAAGVPAVAVLTRTYHEGFPKVLDVLAQVRNAAPDAAKSVPVGVIFYQYDPNELGDAAKSLEPTLRYVKDTAAAGRAFPERKAVIGREDYARLVDALSKRSGAAMKAAGIASDPTQSDVPPPGFNYFPMTVFFDAKGAPLYAIEAVPEAWQLEFALTYFAQNVAASPPPPEAPKVEEPKPEPTEPTEPSEPTEPAPGE